jgi:hypothetical protein
VIIVWSLPLLLVFSLVASVAQAQRQREARR